MRRLIVVVIALAGLAACGKSKSKRERCEAMTAHTEEIDGKPMPASTRADYVDMCTQAAFDSEIDCNLAAKTHDDLMRCAGAKP